MLMNTGTSQVTSSSGLLTTLAYRINDESPVYALEGSISYCGSLIQWLRDNMEFFNSNSESEILASKVSDNGGVYCKITFYFQFLLFIVR